MAFASRRFRGIDIKIAATLTTVGSMVIIYQRMKETQYSKTFDKIPAPDIAISMGCDVGCPYIGRAFDDNWGLQDPTGQSDEVFIEVIKEIENRISQL